MTVSDKYTCHASEIFENLLGSHRYKFRMYACGIIEEKINQLASKGLQNPRNGVIFRRVDVAEGLLLRKVVSVAKFNYF